MMDIWFWVAFWPHTWQAFTVVLGQGVWYEAAHAIGNVVIALAIGPELRTLAGALCPAVTDGGRLGVKLAVAAVALALAASPADYVASHQQPDGGFAEPGGTSDPALTAWSVLGLVAAGRDPGPFGGGVPDGPSRPPARRRSLCASSPCGARPGHDRRRGAASKRFAGQDGRVGPLVNSTIWGVLALRAADRPVAPSIRYLLRAQHRSGGWAWYPRGAPDSNDTAAAVQALRAGGVGARSRPIRRALAYLRRLQHKDGGFSLVRGRASDAQSTAWAIQAFVAARRDTGPRRRFATWPSLRRPDGSYRYSKRYATTPVWVTSQVLPALARRPFPLR